MSKIKKNVKWLDLVINGYLKNAFRIYVPNIIIYRIKMFYTFKNVYPFNIYHYSDNKWNKTNENMDNIIKIYSGGSNLVCVSNDNMLYIAIKCIKNDCVGMHENIKLISESRCAFHSIIYINNALYGVGNNDSNQLSNEKDKNGAIICKNVRKLFGGGIKQIELGKQHSLLLTRKGTVYGVGSNKYGQLLLKNGIQNYDNFTLITALKNINCIRCCGQTSYALNRAGVMVSFGSNKHGSLGTEATNEKRKYRIKSNDKIKAINSGKYHACFITKKREIYLFGDNVWKQCGSENNRKSVKSPLKLKCEYDVINVECGGYHNIIKTNDNKYYAFGRNDRQQCLSGLNGNNTLNSYDIPQYISLNDIQKCIGNNNDIIGFKATSLNTFVIQKM